MNWTTRDQEKCMPKETPQNSKDLQQDPLNLPGAIYSKKIRQI